MSMPAPLTLDRLMRQGRAFLQGHGVANAGLDVRLLAAEALGLEVAVFSAGFTRPVSGPERFAFEDLVARRAKGEPMSHILGRREFWSLDFQVTPATLAPRPDSETLVEAALALVRTRSASLRILDLGTGTGCLLLSLLHELKQAQGVGVDVAEAALDVAWANARALGLEGRVSFVHGSWTENVSGVFDLVISNPPYLSHSELRGLPRELDYEPRLALDGGVDGLDAYRQVIPLLPSHVDAGGHVLLEIGASQAGAVAELLLSQGFALHDIKQDLAGRNRCIVAGLPRPATV